MEKLHPLNELHVNRKHIIINRLYIFLTGISLAALFYYRITSIHRQITTQPPKSSVVFSHVLIFVSELILSFTWALRQAAKWRPVERSVFPENLPEDSKLPSIDVFICTADPNKEPSLDVMNTVISALALDYPSDKLHVYVSDDGGSRVTLMAIRETWKFAKLWIVFCNKFRVSVRCPKAYFSAEGCCNDSYEKSSDEKKTYVVEKSEIKRRYEEFKDSLEKIVAETGTTVSRDHSSMIEVINRFDLEKERLPLLVYVAREKRPFHPHNFKAGTLNVLLRVSAVISNSPYILTLDCDMFCNDPSSARQAMCFLLDSKLSSANNNNNLSFVQFPQRFYNVRSETDIYDGSLREVWDDWKGLDGLEGPVISGTGFYIKRKSLYGPPKFKEDANLIELQKSFGPSNEFVKSISGKHRQKLADDHYAIEGLLAKELQLLASCNYEHDTKWGKEVGFRYSSLVEDYFTSLNLHCQGWTSVYVYPPNPCFLGLSPVTLNDVLVQHGRWCVGLLQVGLSKYFPLIYGPKKTSILQSMGYAKLACISLYSPALYAFAVVPQLCLLKGIALYPEVSSPYFILFPMIFITSQIQHIQEISLSKSHSILTMWRNELRMWMMKSLTSYTYAILETIKEKTGLGKALFLPTNKSVDEEQALRYEEGVYDFQAPPVFMVPLCSLYMLNAASLIFGFSRMFKDGFYEDAMIAQIFIALFVVVLNFPLLEGMVLRHDKGRVSPFVTVVSAAICGIILLLASVC